MRARRRALAAEAPDAAQRAAARLPKELLGRFAVVSGYRAQGAELNPHPLMQQFAQAGARLALPATVGREAPLVFRAFDPGTTLEPDAMGVLSPPPGAEELEPDLVVVPLVAFDREGRRLGQGGGHYDRTLAALLARKPVFVLGLAYAGQIVPTVPAEAHDQRLDAILTEKGYIEVRKDI
jgi:5-formyltetrahydrofolate cyclo-ligase